MQESELLICSLHTYPSKEVEVYENAQAMQEARGSGRASEQGMTYDTETAPTTSPARRNQTNSIPPLSSTLLGVLHLVPRPGKDQMAQHEHRSCQEGLSMMFAGVVMT